jgi:hypothetical protein
MAYKVFTNGSVLNASEINDNLMRQSVMVFSNAAARTAAITSPVEGMLTWLEDVERYETFTTSWVPLVSPGAWTSFTPTFYGFTLGNGTVTAKYSQIGKTVNFFVRVVLGSTSSVSGGGVAVGLPVTKNASMAHPIGEAFFEQTGSALPTLGFMNSGTSSSIADIFVFDTSSSFLTTNYMATNRPFTWTTNHNFGLKGTYEAS